MIFFRAVMGQNRQGAHVKVFNTDIDDVACLDMEDPVRAGAAAILTPTRIGIGLDGSPTVGEQKQPAGKQQCAYRFDSPMLHMDPALITIVGKNELACAPTTDHIYPASKRFHRYIPNYQYRRWYNLLQNGGIPAFHFWANG